MKTEKKEKKKRLVKVIYKDQKDVIQEHILTIEADDYIEDMSYRENIEEVVGLMVEDGGFWVDNSTIIPFHRVLSVHCHIPKTTQKPPVVKATVEKPIVIKTKSNKPKNIPKSRRRRSGGGDKTQRPTAKTDLSQKD